jgi:hypothetical protein
MPKPPLTLIPELAAFHERPISEHSHALWSRYEGVDHTTAALSVGGALMERLKRTEAAADLSADVYALTQRDLYAIVLANVFAFRQDADPEVWGDYGEWTSSGPTRPPTA